MRSRSVLPLPIGLVAALWGACGESEDVIRDAGIDASTRIDAVPPPAGCDWAEGGEEHNDTRAEDTRLAVTNAPVVMCGTLEARAPADGLVDNDAFSIDVPADGQYLLRLTAGDDPGPTALYLDLLDEDGNVFAFGGFAAGHAAAWVELIEGTYAIEAYSISDTIPTAPIPYALSIAPDDRDTRCGTPGTPDFTEASDGAGHRGNDVISVAYEPEFVESLTAAVDAPEATGLTADGTTRVITGTSGNLGSDGDPYYDRDTYAFTVAAGTNQLDLRLAWAGDTTDLDLLLFPADGDPPIDLASDLLISNEEDSYITTAVEPGSYWLWVGAYEGSTGLPMAYDLAICSSTFAP